MTDPLDASTFTAVDSIHVIGEAGGQYTEYTLSFTQYSGDGEYLALQFYTVSGSQWLRVDDMTLEVAPSCAAPDSLAMVSSTTSSVTLTWQTDASDLTLYYKALSDNEYTAIPNVVLDADNSYTISDLTSATNFTWSSIFFGMTVSCLVRYRENAGQNIWNHHEQQVHAVGEMRKRE